MFLRYGFGKLGARLFRKLQVKTQWRIVELMLANSYNRFKQPLSKICMQYSKSIPNPTPNIDSGCCVICVEHRPQTRSRGWEILRFLQNVDAIKVIKGKGVTLFQVVWTYLLTGLVAGMLLTPNVPLQRNCLEGRTQWYIRGIDAEMIFFSWLSLNLLYVNIPFVKRV